MLAIRKSASQPVPKEVKRKIKRPRSEPWFRDETYNYVDGVCVGYTRHYKLYSTPSWKKSKSETKRKPRPNPIRNRREAKIQKEIDAFNRREPMRIRHHWESFDFKDPSGPIAEDREFEENIRRLVSAEHAVQDRNFGYFVPGSDEWYMAIKRYLITNPTYTIGIEECHDPQGQAYGQVHLLKIGSAPNRHQIVEYPVPTLSSPLKSWNMYPPEWAGTNSRYSRLRERQLAQIYRETTPELRAEYDVRQLRAFVEGANPQWWAPFFTAFLETGVDLSVGRISLANFSE